MEISFSHQLAFEDYKKWLIDVYYLKNKKRMFGYIAMMVAGVLLIIFKATNAFHMDEHYPKETLYLLGGSFIITPVLFYIGVIRNAKKYFNADPNIGNPVKYIFDEEMISFESHDGNTGTCKWQNVKAIEEDDHFVRIVVQNNSTYLLVKSKIPSEPLYALHQLLQKIKQRSGAIDHLN
ncbi:MAG: hypothetical protein JWN78_2776 [Bacteroidota bacterium]|nr:hypothetical protein [Bacteroidota bacterium]